MAKKAPAKKRTRQKATTRSRQKATPTKKPTAKKTVAKKPRAKKPTAKKTVAKKPTVEDPPMLRTWAEVAEAFGVHIDTARKTWPPSGMPKLPCLLKDVQAWRETLKDRADEIEDAGEEVRAAKRLKIIAEARKTDAHAELAEYKMRLMNDHIVRLEDVERFLSDLFVETQQIFRRIPHEIKAGYPAEWREDLAVDITARIDLALRAMHGHAETLVDIRVQE